MAEIKGLGLGGMITPGGDSANTFPTHEDIYGKGGYMVVSSRTGISAERVKKGMLVYDSTDSKIYKCVDAAKYNQTAGWEELKTTYDGGGKYLGAVSNAAGVKSGTTIKAGDFYRASSGGFKCSNEDVHAGDIIMATVDGGTTFDVLHTEQTTDTTVTSNGVGAIVNLTGTNSLTATKSPINGLNYQSASGNSKTCSCWRNSSFNNFTCTATQGSDCKTWSSVAPSSSEGKNFAIYTTQLQTDIFAGYTGYITIQVKVKSNLDLTNTGCKFGCNTDGSYGATFYNIPKDTWTTVTHTFQIQNWTKPSAYVYFYTGTADTTQTISLKEFKIELGPVATPWTPAYSDFLDLSTMSALKANTATYATNLGSSSNKVGVSDVALKTDLANYLPLTGGTLTGKVRSAYMNDSYYLTKGNLFNDDTKSAVDNASLVIGGSGDNMALRTAFSRASLQSYYITPKNTTVGSTKYTENTFTTNPFVLQPLGGSVAIGSGDINGVMLSYYNGSSFESLLGIAKQGGFTAANTGDLVIGSTTRTTTVRSSTNLRLQPESGKIVQIGPDNADSDTVKTNLKLTSGTSPQITIGPSVIKYNKSTGCLEIQG